MTRRDESILRITDEILAQDNPTMIFPVDFEKGGRIGKDTVQGVNGFTRFAKFKDTRGATCVYLYHAEKDEWSHNPMGEF